MASAERLRDAKGRGAFVLRAGVLVRGERDAYEVVGERGHGGFGRAYAVRALRTGDVFILKMSAEARNGAGGERIRREQFVLRRCGERRSGLVPELVDSGEIEGRPFFVMENLQPLGWSDDNEFGLPDTDEKRRAFFSLLIDSLKAVHDAGFVHCDVKPQNILERGQDRRPVLIDFGSAHPIVSSPACRAELPEGWMDLTRSEGRAWSLGYDADEDAYTIQKDIFALGQVMRDSFGEDVDLAWAEIINKCISRRPEFRYESLDALKDDVENIARRRRALYWSFRKDKIREQRETERSLSAAEPEEIRRDAILRVDEKRSGQGLTVLWIKFPKGECRHYVVSEPIALKENTVLIVSGRGILEARVSGPSSSAVVLRDYATLHNTDVGLPPENDLTYVIVGPGSYLNFPNLRPGDYGAFFPDRRRRILRDLDATTSFRFAGPATFSGVEDETVTAVRESGLPDCYKDVLTKFFKGEAFTVLPSS